MVPLSVMLDFIAGIETSIDTVATFKSLVGVGGESKAESRSWLRSTRFSASPSASTSARVHPYQTSSESRQISSSCHMVLTINDMSHVIDSGKRKAETCLPLKRLSLKSTESSES